MCPALSFSLVTVAAKFSQSHDVKLKIKLVQHTLKYYIKCLNMFLTGKALMPLGVYAYASVSFHGEENKYQYPSVK